MTHTHLPLTPEWLLWPWPWVWLLALLPLLPLLWLLWRHPRRRPVIRFSSLDLLRMAGGTWRRHLRTLLPVLRTAALACLIIALGLAPGALLSICEGSARYLLSLGVP